MRLILIALLITTLLAGCTRSLEVLKKAGSKVSKSVVISTTSEVEKTSVTVPVIDKDRINQTESELPSFKFSWDIKTLIR